MSSKPTLPTFEEITRPSVHELFAPPTDEEAGASFLDDLFVPPKPETYGRIAPAAAPVKPAKGKCRVTTNPATRWFHNLNNTAPELWNDLISQMKQAAVDERTKILHTAYSNYLLAQERAALNEQLSVVKSWRG